MSGSSLASFSRATSAMGPKMTTGRRNPAAQEGKGQMVNGVLFAVLHFGALGGLCSNLPSARPSHRRGTLSARAAPTDPPCSCAGSSWSCAALGTSRSRLCLRRGSWGGCTARWTAARLWTEDSNSRGSQAASRQKVFLVLCITCCPDLAERSENKRTKATIFLLSNIFAAPTMWALPLFDVEERRPSFDVCFWRKYYQSLDVIFKVQCFEKVFPEGGAGYGGV